MCPQCSDRGYLVGPPTPAEPDGALSLCRTDHGCICGGDHSMSASTPDGVRWCHWCAVARGRMRAVHTAFACANIPDDLRGKRIVDVNQVGRARLAGRMVDHVVKFGSSKPPHGALFYGPRDRCKTFTACVVLTELILATHLAGRFVRIADLSQTIRAEMEDPDGRSERDLVDPLQRIPYLVIDEIGVRTDSAFALGLVYSIVDARLSRRLFTIVTTNLSPDDLGKIDKGRTASRLSQLCEFIDFRCAAEHRAAARVMSAV